MNATRYCDKCVVNPAQKNDNLCEDCRRKVNKQADSSLIYEGFEKSKDNEKRHPKRAK
jgi:hypothetical protein